FHPNNMANFSVEWLSRSFHEEGAQDALPHSKVRRDIEEFKKESSPTSCGYTSGSESEVGEDSEGEAAAQRRMRTKFSSQQIGKLEKSFSKNKYLGAVQRRTIAERLNLSETQVKTWFQNRRMKLKREVQDLRSEFLPVPAALLPPLLLLLSSLCLYLSIKHPLIMSRPFTLSNICSKLYILRFSDIIYKVYMFPKRHFIVLMMT
uniref:Homeobox domain-containing protein n=1 Tax=Labrus bergylta TaxID=56723 RepID=A0A3Q3LDG9_9LABR